ncbi:Zn-dependent hydrolase [Labrys wisconsinensis]|uniref:N-carbamoyl-L-amino-acid hydrolase n=1 Tax=Labrys wisconsinensis TaxID=425677 RepID=A0ABU0J4P1_9HYPH|nr:Zn-dependent hydrolase [Labrys wisconsinensis]MDQ0469239.1 N-carbamoyl-L-amino-acid hydrolase [Labrys wisconsinensis]
MATDRPIPTVPAVDGNRLWDSLTAMAALGATAKGGCRRVAFTDEDRRGRDLFRSWCEVEGLRVSVDVFGNMFARRPGRSNLPPVLVGSHLDTQPTGGRFDGVYGVLAGLELVRTLNAAGIMTERPIEIVNWTNEEGAIYRSMMGSEVFTGALALEEALALVDLDGRRLGDALDAIGYRGTAGLWSYPVHCYFEAHIEQGPVLEAHGTTIGVVTDGIAFRRYAITIEGREAHAGPTPMALRRDAMVTAAALIGATHAHALEVEGARATFGYLKAHPGVPNTLAGRVEMSADLRHREDEMLDGLEERLAADLQRVCAEQGTSATLRRVVTSPRVRFHPALRRRVAEAAQALGYSREEIVSGAGHDACNIARRIPAAMIFIPCKDGISHNEAESAEPADCEAGCNVLLHAVLAAANDTTALEAAP